MYTQLACYMSGKKNIIFIAVKPNPHPDNSCINPHVLHHNLPIKNLSLAFNNKNIPGKMNY